MQLALCVTLNIKQQWWEFTGATWKSSSRENISSSFMVLASFICQNGWRLDILSPTWLHHGGAIICYGQRNLNVHKRESLALQRPHHWPCNAILCVDCLARLLDIVLSRFRSFSGASEYRFVTVSLNQQSSYNWFPISRFWYSWNEGHSQRSGAEGIFDV